MNLCPGCIASALSAGSFVVLWGSGRAIEWFANRRRARALEFGGDCHNDAARTALEPTEFATARQDAAG